MKSREDRCIKLQVENDQLREQVARQSAIINSLKNRIHELESRERNTYAVHSHNELTVVTFKKELDIQAERIYELEKKLHAAENDVVAEQQKRISADSNFHNMLRQLAVALGASELDSLNLTVFTDALIHKANQLLQEQHRLRSKSSNINEKLSGIEMELYGCKESLGRSTNEKDHMQMKLSNQNLEIDRLNQEKDQLEIQAHNDKREILTLRDQINQLESKINRYRDELKTLQEKNENIQHHHRQEIDDLTDKLQQESESFNREQKKTDDLGMKFQNVEEENLHLTSRLMKIESDLKNCQISKDRLERDKHTFILYLKRLAQAMNLDEALGDFRVELHTESLILRANQLVSMENEKLMDKRRIRALREQLQRKDLHLDLLRRKLTLQDDNCKIKCVLQTERDEANLRNKKLAKQVERLQMQLSDVQLQCRELNVQLSETVNYKIVSLERARKIEELQTRLTESELLRTKYNRKVTLLKDQVRSTGDTIEQERKVSDYSVKTLREELSLAKEQVANVMRRESQLNSFKTSITKILGLILPASETEIISKIKKIADAHHDFTLISRRYDGLDVRSSAGDSHRTVTPDRLRCDDSGYIDVRRDSDISDV